MMKKTLSLALALTLTLSLAACGGSGGSSSSPSNSSGSSSQSSASGSSSSANTGSDVAYIQDKGTLVVGITEFAPMDYKDENGEWIGFDADMARKVAEALGVDVEFSVIEWGQQAVRAGRQDGGLPVERHDHHR